MGHLAKPRDASFFRVFFNPYHYGVLTVISIITGDWFLYTRNPNDLQVNCESSGFSF